MIFGYRHGFYIDDRALIEPNSVKEGEERWHVIGSITGLVVVFAIYTEREHDEKEATTSSRPDKPKKLSTGDILTPEAIARLKVLADRPDSEIAFSDIPPMSAERLASMIPLKQFLAMRMKKESVTVRIDKDVPAWLRGEGDGYQTRLNHNPARRDGASGREAFGMRGRPSLLIVNREATEKSNRRSSRAGKLSRSSSSSAWPPEAQTTNIYCRRLIG